MATLMTLINVVFVINLTTNPLVPSLIVYALSFYQRLCYTMGFMFSSAFTKLIHAWVSLDRMKEFLLAEEINDMRQTPRDSRTAIQMDKFSFKWKKEDNSGIDNVSIKVNKGELVALVGPVGSGKVIN
jgi:ABC-type multidrug transport system fused ATPase/permease subunit